MQTVAKIACYKVQTTASLHIQLHTRPFPPSPSLAANLRSITSQLLVGVICPVGLVICPVLWESLVHSKGFQLLSASFDLLWLLYYKVVQPTLQYNCMVGLDRFYLLFYSSILKPFAYYSSWKQHYSFLPPFILNSGYQSTDSCTYKYTCTYTYDWMMMCICEC